MSLDPSRRRRAGRTAFTSGTVGRRLLVVAGFLAISLAWMPALMTSLLALGDRSGDHEVLCSVTRGGFEVTLHHSPGEAADHRHSLLERVLIGKARGGDPDHHLRFCHDDQLPEDDTCALPQAVVPADCPAFIVHREIPADDRADPAFAGLFHDWRGPPEIWRGQVMRL
ncbi:hypothetical protein [Haloferula helveola]